MRRNEQEDHTMDGYLNLAQAMDESMVPAVGIVPRGWLLVGLIGLTPAFVSGNASPLELAIGMGGVILASRELTGGAGAGGYCLDAGCTAVSRGQTETDVGTFCIVFPNRRSGRP